MDATELRNRLNSFVLDLTVHRDDLNKEFQELLQNSTIPWVFRIKVERLSDLAEEITIASSVLLSAMIELDKIDRGQPLTPAFLLVLTEEVTPQVLDQATTLRAKRLTARFLQEHNLIYNPE